MLKFECPYCGETFEYRNWLVWVFKTHSTFSDEGIQNVPTVK